MRLQRTIRGVAIDIEAVRCDGDYIYGPALTVVIEPIRGRRVKVQFSGRHERRKRQWGAANDSQAGSVCASFDVDDWRPPPPDDGIPF